MTLIDRLHAFAERLGFSPQVFDPLVFAACAVAVSWATTGTFNAQELKLAGLGVLMGLIGYVAPVLRGLPVSEVRRRYGR